MKRASEKGKRKKEKEKEKEKEKRKRKRKVEGDSFFLVDCWQSLLVSFSVSVFPFFFLLFFSFLFPWEVKEGQRFAHRRSVRTWTGQGLGWVDILKITPPTQT